MSTTGDGTGRHDEGQSLCRRGRWAFIGFTAIAVFLLAAEHRAHLLGWLPWLVLLACPLMHLFMHHGRHAHDRHESNGERR